MQTSVQDNSVDVPELAPLEVLGRVSSGLAHDLRTPLTIVRNAVYLLRRSNPDDPKIVELLDMIDAETDAMNLILTGLNEITHSRNPEPEAIDVSKVLPEVAARVDVNNLMDWRFDFDPPSIVWCDLPQFRLMMNKVFRNAVAAMKGQGQVLVRVRHEKDDDIIEVRDKGPGVAEAVRSNLFEPFVTTKQTGMGLGLTYAREIVRRHGGKIEVAESSPAGTTIRISLPRAAEEPLQPQ